MAAKKPIGYDKILLGVGGAVALGLITMVVLKAGGVEDAFETTSGTPKEAPEIPGEIPVAGAIASLKDAPKWEIGEKDGKWTRHELPTEVAGHGIGFGDINGDGRGEIGRAHV
jgi:hypothetical protein